MIHKTRPFRTFLLAALLCGTSAAALLAQGPEGGPPPGGEHGQHHRPPPSPLFDALDTNHDGVISAEEMNNATTSLKTLLKNGAAELRREDQRPPRPAPAPATSQPSASPATAGTPTAPTANPGTTTGAPVGGAEGHPHHGPPPSPLFDALDTNHDGVISSAEMDSAPASLKTLLKNGATELRREDLRPAHPPQGQGN